MGDDTAKQYGGESSPPPEVLRKGTLRTFIPAIESAKLPFNNPTSKIHMLLVMNLTIRDLCGVWWTANTECR